MSKLTHYSPVTKSIMPCTGNCKYGENAIEYDEYGNEFQVIHSREGETEAEFLQRIEEYEESEAIKREGTVLGTIRKKPSMQKEVNQVSQSMRQQGKLGGQEQSETTSAATDTSSARSLPSYKPENTIISQSDYTAADRKEHQEHLDRLMAQDGDIYVLQKHQSGKWTRLAYSKRSDLQHQIQRKEKDLQKSSKAYHDLKNTLEQHGNSIDGSILSAEEQRIVKDYNNDQSEYAALLQEQAQFEQDVAAGAARHKERVQRARAERKIRNRWRNGQKRAQTLLNRDKRPEYIQSIDEKHITGSGAGSKFTDDRIKKTEDVIALANVQRGNLDGDDRDKLIAAGADPNSFLPPESGVRYLMVETKGSEALKDTAKMNDDDVVHIVAKGRNDGKPPSMSFVVDVKEQPKTEVGTIIVVPDSDENKQPIPNTEILWTTHPGVPTRGIRSDTVREKGLKDGDTITVKELRETFGRDVVANTRLVE